jgi:hypothetical protein
VIELALRESHDALAQRTLIVVEREVHQAIALSFW